MSAVTFRTEEVDEVSSTVDPSSTQHPLSTSTDFFVFSQQIYSIDLSNKPQYNSKCSLLEICLFYLYNDNQPLLKFLTSSSLCLTAASFLLRSARLSRLCYFSSNVCYLSIAPYRPSSLQSKSTKSFSSLLVGADPSCS
jgi:hypothetical protein